MNATALHTYLSDHLTGSSVVVHVGRRRLERTGESWLARFLDELEEERTALRRLADELEGGSAVRRALGRVAASVGRLKLRVDAVRDDDLRDLLELELMRTGIEGKRCLWRSLMLLDDDPRIARLDLQELDRRAERQATTVERFRAAAAARLGAAR